MSTIVVDEHGRPEPPLAAGEVETLLGFLDFQRATLEWKTRGLGADGLRHPLHPTGMTLAGLLKHLAWVEDHWFTHTAGRAPMPDAWRGVDRAADPDWEWRTAVEDDPADLRRGWEEAVARSRASVARLLAEDGAGLVGAHPAWGGRAQVSLRWILVHMVEEYARHNGHADLLREAVDGGTGE
ncbi:DinB family protein [Ornithinimicrobium sp. LYQ103]|uniref:DinB family protein n=1 Tax=Ornithinimicrobium sp. LYQ103 TaxID=3378796 RepID=UPI0038547C00